MNQFSVASDFCAVADELRGLQLLDIARAAAFIGALLLAWISLHPFIDLSNMLLTEVTMGNEAWTYAAFAALAVLTVALAMRDGAPGFATLLSPGYLAMGGWITVMVAMSIEPGTSARRFVLAMSVAAVAASLMLLPRNQTELRNWLATAILTLLTACYLGFLLVPNLSIHLATDAQEPALAGAWRGVFGHKNMAAGMMAMLLFLSIFIMRAGSWLAGGIAAGLTLLFLINTEGKSALALCFGVLVLTSLAAMIRSFWFRAAVLLMPLVLLNMIGIGSVMSETLAAISKALPLDASFTGRTDIWTFGLEVVRLKLWTGYGFSAFWGSSAVRNLPQGMEWAATAAHSHNGYLDITLALGLPGLALLIAVFVIKPLRDFHGADQGGNNGPLAQALLQVWLFGLYLSSLESFFFDRADQMWFTMMVAMFGLHYLARFRLAE
ncbi:MAG TPA: O-antigen ligase [Bradyrhizobium sp.]|uniref:O-antigen ligase family protein n=1 Tax=Bradyrhizobium sp. TaxID=376 RepID=UPI002D7F42E4|nr:O-antigen ligase [Bradyrhizobium sp.]HET7888062.1 O-antigen ligase [Bradyrhizobium sp.]